MIFNTSKNKAIKRDYYGKFPMLGFYTKNNIITLDSNNKIKKVSQKDHKAISERIEVSNYKEFEYLFHYDYSSTDNVYYPEEIINKFQYLNCFFKIFKPESIGLPFCQHYIVEKENKLTGIGFLSEPRVSFYEETPYILEKFEISKLKIFWKNYHKLIQKKHSSFNVAIRRFYILNQKFDQEDKLLDILIAFEALFLSETAELSYRLSLRISKFLQEEYDSASLFDFIKRVYSIRSKIVHGSPIKSKDLKFNEDQLTLKIFNADLIEILRKALNKYITQYSDYTNSQLCTKIDEAIISGKELANIN